MPDKAFSKRVGKLFGMGILARNRPAQRLLKVLEQAVCVLMRIGVFKVKKKQQQGWSLAEVMVAVAVLAVIFVSLFAGLAFGFKVIKATREDLRATQILTQKIES